MKKFLSLILTFSIVLGLFSGLSITNTVKATTVRNVNYVMYQASQYSRKFYDIFGNASSSYANTYFNHMRNDTALMASISTWEGIHIATSPSYSIESGLLLKKDLYKLAIFDMLDVANKSTFVSESADIFANSRNKYLYSVAKKITDSSDIDVSELKSYEVTAEHIKLMNETATAAKMFDVLEVASTIAENFENLYDLANAYASYQAISNMKNGIKEVLTAITELPSGSLGEHFDDADLAELKAAANECISYFDGAYDNLLSRILNGTEPFTFATYKTVYTIALDWAWGVIVNSIPGGAAVLIGAKGIRVLANTVFEMDKTTQTYYQLEACVALENAIRKVMINSECDYEADHNFSKAVGYMQAVDMYKRIVLQGFEYSIELLENQASAPATKWLDWLTGNYSECITLISEIESFKHNKKLMYDNFEKTVSNGFNSLYCLDYDSIINGFDNQEIVQIESVSLSQIKEINVGDTGYIGNYIDIIRNPENSNALLAEDFTSENEEIIKLNDYDFIEVLREGECTIVFNKGTTLETQITITVGAESTDNAYDYLSDFKYSVNSDGKTATITDYTGSLQKLIIPSEINGYLITAIGMYAFKGCSALAEIVIPESVTYIGARAFEGTAITEITIPKNVATMYSDTNNTNWNTTYESALVGAVSLTKVIFADGMKTIPSRATNNCATVTSVTIPDSVTSIGSYAFSRCTGFNSLEIPSTVTTINQYAFNGCTNLNNVEIPVATTTIGRGAFQNCTSLDIIKLNENLTKIDMYAFKGCSALAEIVVPESVTYIGARAFEGTAITEITIPKNVATMYSDTNDTNWNTTYESALVGAVSLTKVIFDDGMKTIPSRAIQNCTTVTSVTIPFSVIDIATYVFLGCNDLTINCHYSSAAKNYAIANGINYSLIRTNGDASGDGVVNSDDLVSLKKHLLSGDEISPDGNCNNDSIVDLRDLLRMKLIIAGMI